MRKAVIVALAIVVSAGCGGGGDNESGSAARTAIDADAQEHAESILLQLTDFPDGWRASTPDDDDDEGADEFRACIGVDFSRFTRTGDARSRDFAKDNAEASSEVAVFEDEGQAREAVDEQAAGMRSAEVDECVSELLSEALEEDDQEFELGEVDVGELNLTAPDVEQTSAWQVAITLEFTSGAAEGLSPTVYLDMVHLREGATVATVETVDVLSAFDPDLRDELLRTTASRMSAR